MFLSDTRTNAGVDHVIYSVSTMAEAARIVGEAVREVHRRDALSLAEFSVAFNCSFISAGRFMASRRAACSGVRGG